MNNAQYIKDCYIINGTPSIEIGEVRRFLLVRQEKVSLRVDIFNFDSKNFFLRAIGFDASFFVATS